jgi:hypothetical protein
MPNISWVATFNDGSTLTEVQQKLSGCKLDRTRLKSFALYSSDRQIMIMTFAAGDIFQYRVRNVIMTESDDRERIHILVRHHNSDKTIIFVSESDLCVNVASEYGQGPLQHEILDDPTEMIPVKS